jgi:uncharacterized protein (DUF58 family)
MASLIGWGAAGQGDRFGGVIFSDTEHNELKPQRGRTAVLRFIRQLVTHPAWATRATAAADADAGLRALVRLRRVVRPGSLVFMLSDFRWFDARARVQLVRLAQHNEVVLTFIYDPLERTLPPPGRYRVSDGRAELLLETYDDRQAQEYAQRFVAREAALEQLARQHGMHLLRYCTQQDPATTLREGLRSGPKPR